MLNYVIITALLVVAGIVLYRLTTRWMDQTAERMVAEYVEAFPGRCMICSYHRYGLQEGMTRNPKPPPHECIEKPRE